jgi:sec-independent protein translocase protein TatA
MSVGPAELLVILIVGLLVFGPHKLPEVGRQVGAAVRELRKMQDAVRGELDMVLHPEHGTRAPDAPYVAEEPEDHTAIDDGEIDYGDFTPEEPAADAPDSPEASDDEHRFRGPPDSFI